MSIRLVLVRHAKSDYPAGVVDHDRPLNERGRRDAPQIGVWLFDHLHPSADVRVVVSSARRAQETWQYASGSLPNLMAATDHRIYEAAPSTLRAVAVEHAAAPDSSPDAVVLVGHNPGLQRLTAELAAPGAQRSSAVDRFPTSAVVVLDSQASWADALAGVGTFEVSSFGIPRG